MKKALAIVLALSLSASLFLLAGCSSDEKDTTTEPDSVVSAPEPEEQEPEEQTPEYERGIATDTGFESEWLGVRFTAPEGYVMATEDEMLEMMQLGAEAMDLGSEAVDYAQLTTVYEMMASTPTGLPNVVAMVEKLSFSSMSLEQYFEALRTQLEPMGYVVSEELGSADIAGQSYSTGTASVSVNDVDMTQKFYMNKVDNRMIVFSVTYSADTEADAEALMTAFQPY